MKLASTQDCRWDRGALLAFLWGASSLLFAQTPDPATTTIEKPIPVAVSPAAQLGQPPSDALILMDGSSLEAWEKVGGGKPEWRLYNGVVTVVPGSSNIRTKRSFGDIQLHLEWRSPPTWRHAKNLKSASAAAIKEQVAEQLGMHQFMANSGIFLQERYEVQVLETYGEQTYVNGQSGSVYKQHIPLVDASREPGQWQVYDMVFQAPRFGAEGAVIVPAKLTVFHNGVLIQNHVSLWGPTEFLGLPNYAAHGPAPIELQSHAAVSQISYRNIWVREL